MPAHLRFARAIMNAWMPHSKEGDVRIYSEAEMRRILGTWFSDVSWRRVGQTGPPASPSRAREPDCPVSMIARGSRVSAIAFLDKHIFLL